MLPVGFACVCTTVSVCVHCIEWVIVRVKGTREIERGREIWMNLPITMIPYIGTYSVVLSSLEFNYILVQSLLMILQWLLNGSSKIRPAPSHSLAYLKHSQCVFNNQQTNFFIYTVYLLWCFVWFRTECEKRDSKTREDENRENSRKIVDFVGYLIW